jgi:broad specificity phosphatase PhoE
LRCQETAKIIESRSVFKFTQTPLLNEFTENEFPQFLARMKEARSFLLNLSAEHIAICTHGAVVAALQKLLVNQEFHAHELMYYPKTGVIVKVDGEHVTSIDLNS